MLQMHYTITFDTHTGVYICTVNDMSRNVLESFYGEIIDIQSAMSDHEPFLALYDVRTNLMVSLTPTVRQMATHAAQANPDQYGKSALLIGRIVSFVLFPLQNFVEKELNRHQPNMQFKLFSEWNAAIEWLTA
jgi:hypothetical protein